VLAQTRCAADADERRHRRAGDETRHPHLFTGDVPNRLTPVIANCRPLLSGNRTEKSVQRLVLAFLLLGITPALVWIFR
jgi:hypothetical protein